MSQSKLVTLPPLPLNSGFGVRFARDSAAGAVTGLPLLFALDKVGGKAADRVELTEADATLSGSDFVITFSKDQGWTAANLSAGQYRGRLFVNGVYDSGVYFEAYTPDNGEIGP